MTTAAVVSDTAMATHCTSARVAPKSAAMLGSVTAATLCTITLRNVPMRITARPRHLGSRTSCSQPPGSTSDAAKASFTGGRGSGKVGAVGSGSHLGVWVRRWTWLGFALTLTLSHRERAPDLP